MNLTKKQKIGLFLVLGLLVLLGVALIAVKKPQEIRPRAAGSGEVDLKFEPNSGNKGKGESFEVQLNLYKTANRAINISGAQAVVNVSDKFAINSATCEPPFNGMPVATVNGQTVTFMCGIALGANPVALEATGKSFATFKVSVKNDAAHGEAPISFTSTRVTEAGQTGQAPDVSTGGQNASFTVGGTGGPTLTPTPTRDPTACLTLPTTDTFEGATPSAELWDIWRGGNWSLNQTGGVLRLAVTSTSGGGQARVISKKKVCGDFDVRVDFSQFTNDSKIAASLLTIEQLESGSAVYMGMYKVGNRQGFGTDLKLNGDQTDHLYLLDSSVSTGKLRIRRRGAVFTTFYDNGLGWKELKTYTDGFSQNANIVFGVITWDNENSSISSNFDNFYLNTAQPDPTFTPVPSATPTPSISPIPTPPSGREKYTIDVGDKQFLSFNIAPGQTPQIRFKASLSFLQNKPQLFLKLRVKDELAFMNNPSGGEGGDSCNNPPAGSKDFYIPAQADGDVYKPVQDIGGPPPGGGKAASVSVDGWVSLDGVIPGRYYTLLLKGPKTRSVKVTEHVLLQPNQNTEVQDFDWTSKGIDPGDLPDPNNGMKQDCTVNSIDLSLITSRLGATDGDSLNIGDVNYDGVINGNDVSKVVNTLSTKPDDDL